LSRQEGKKPEKPNQTRLARQRENGCTRLSREEYAGTRRAGAVICCY